MVGWRSTRTVSVWPGGSRRVVAGSPDEGSRPVGGVAEEPLPGRWAVTGEREPVRSARKAIRSGGLCGPCLRVLPVTGVAVSTLSGPIHTETVCASDDVAFRLDELQFDLGEGPAWEAFASRRPVLVPDLSTDPQPSWPVFTAAVQPMPVRALFAFPLYVGATGVGVLDCYRTAPGPLDRRAVREARVLADTVAAELLRRVLAADDPDRGDQATSESG
jgi:GAF domain-containing protein